MSNLVAAITSSIALEKKTPYKLYIRWQMAQSESYSVFFKYIFQNLVYGL